MTKMENPQDWDMIDTEEDLHNYQPLEKALRKCGEIVNSIYSTADKAALQHQKYHRRLTNFAVVFGTLAVLLAILQLVLLASPRLTSFTPSRLPNWAELAAAVIALGSVIMGFIQSRQKQWLLQRHKAERCRFLKFRFIIDTDLWANDSARTTTWENRILRELNEINELTPQSLYEWAEKSEVSDVPP